MLKGIEVLLLFALIFVFGFLAGNNYSIGICQRKAIKYKCAEYNTTTGNFQWKTRN